MAQIVPKLNLNKIPSLVEPNSLIFAKNIRIDVDGSIHKDYGVSPLSISKGKYVEENVNYKNIINRIKSDISYNENQKSYYNVVKSKLDSLEEHNIGKVVGIIADSNEFYVFLYGSYKDNSTDNVVEISLIFKYSEDNKTFSFCDCNWNYSGGIITGCVITNLTGDKILNIGESNTDILVPFKSINFTNSSIDDDELKYTQTPNVPLTNLNFANNFSAVIPNGVYQFFVRYRFDENFYTNWFPASKEIFVGNKNTIITSFGKLEYLNTHRDSDNSFTLSVEHLLEDNKIGYKDYQIGFILSHDDTVYARGWKHFKFDITSVNFDYKSEDSEELEVIDFIKPTYGLYNVGNITSFKNKLYVSNYIETDFNEDLQNVADAVEISIGSEEGNNTYNSREINQVVIDNKNVINGLKINEEIKHFFGENGIYKDIVTYNSENNISSVIEQVLDNIKGNINYYSPEIEGIRILCKIDSIEKSEQTVKDKYKNSKNGNITYSFDFGEYTINNITFDNEIISKNNVISKIYNTPRYLTTSCNWIKSNGDVYNSSTIKIKRTCRVTETIKYNNGDVKPYDSENNSFEELQSSNMSRITTITRPNINTEETTIKTKDFYVSYYQNIVLTFVADNSKLNVADSSTLLNKTTLLPYQKYKFYIHFVKSNGETTNGYECFHGQEITPDYQSTCKVLYPIFKNISIPTSYKACFFSILHTGIITSTIFDITDSPDTSIKEGRCFDINMMLVPNNKNINIRQAENETNSGLYYYSSDTSYNRYFGADGVITFNLENTDKTKLAYAVTNYSSEITENIELIKCTPFITEKHLKTLANNINSCYFDKDNMNLLGYICNVSPLNKERCLHYYSDGSSIYYKTISDYSQNSFEKGTDIKLDELYKYADAEIEDYKKLSNFGLINSVNSNIYSNYNLNFITLSEEPKMSIKTYYTTDADNTSSSEKNKNTGISTFLRLLSSQLLSDVYELPNMYKTYTRKTYSIYKENDTNTFDNTVRSSILYGDENKVNILTFDANDYYNVPTNRGKIINLVSVGDAIIVHTRDSMFKFSGSNNLLSSNGEILTTESKPFETGINEVFGSDFGFAGIQNKQDHIITENGYIFFDRDSKIVYVYSGQGQIAKISDSIEKLFNHRKIENISFANDYYNNRFFLSIIFYEDENIIDNDKLEIKRKYYPATLSFNFSEQIKSFVSLHDFYYHKAFNTKTNCYFLTSDNKDICSIDKNNLGIYTKLELSKDKIYPQKTNIVKHYIYITDKEINPVKTEHSITKYSSIIDVIYNVNYETIKTLNSISWCSNKTKNEFSEIDEDILDSICMAESISTVNDIPCDYIRIYSDTCLSNLLNCKNSSNSSIDNYKYPRYNQGIWSFNYFRNILNSNNNINKYNSDQNSLIEGKYFVIRFVFNDDFKFETLTVNYSNKIWTE